MKKSSLKSLTSALALSMATILLALPSCKSVEPTTLHHTTQHYTTLHNAVDTVVIRDTVYRHDSIIYRERTIHDTVYITKEVYRDALNSKFKIQNSTKTDTVVVTEYRDRVIEHPPEKYVPKFHKWCTSLFCILVLVFILYLILRFVLPKH